MSDLLPCVEYTAHVWREGDSYVAHAVPLDVTSAGAAPEEAQRALDEAVRLFLRVAADRGTLEQILEEAGYERRGATWVSPICVSIEKRTAAVEA